MASATTRLSKVLADTGRFEEGCALLEAVLEVNPQHPDTLLALCDLSQGQGDFSKAEGLLRTLWTAKPTHVRGAVRLAKCLAESGRLDEGSGVLVNLLASRPRNPDALDTLADLRLRQGSQAEAEVLYRKILELRPAHVPARIKLAKILADTGRLGESFTILENALALRPDHADVLVELGNLLTKANEYRTAMDFFERATHLPSSPVSAWLGLARASAKAISTSAALDVLQACRSQRDLPVVDIELANQLIRSGRIAEAEQIALSAAARFPDHVHLQRMLLRLDILAGRYEVALSRLADMPKASPREALEGLRLRAKLEKARWQIGESLQTYGEIAGAPGSGHGDHRAFAESLMISLDIVGARRELRQSNGLQAAKLRTQGKSTNISQGLFGEILNDFWTDPIALAAAQKARKKASTETWMQAVTRYSHHTGCALGFIVHLRQAGRLRSRKTRRTSIHRGAIPRELHQFWDTPAPPQDVAQLIESWQGRNPGWTHKLHSVDTASAFLKENFGGDVFRAFRISRTLAGKADIFRLAILFLRGGVYADADDYCVSALDRLIQGRELVLRQEHLGSIGNNFIAARPNHPIVGHALEQAVAAVLRGDRDSIWLSSGPGLLTRVAATFLAADRARLKMLGREIFIADGPELREYCVSGCQASYKNTERNWQHTEFARIRLAMPVPRRPVLWDGIGAAQTQHLILSETSHSRPVRS